MVRRLVPVMWTALWAGCGSSTPTDKEDTDGLEVLDTFVDETGDTEDTREPADPNDSGSYYLLEIDGRADVARGVKFLGWQTLTARWYKRRETKLLPRCIYAWDVQNWERDDDRQGQTNPILAEDFDLCPNCTFAFTLTLKNVRYVDRYPWNEPTDTDTDTDVPPDIVGSDPSTERSLNCTTLTENQDYLTPEEIEADENNVIPEWIGIGFDPVSDNDGDDVRTGYLLKWEPRAITWVRYAYSATFDPYTGDFEWSEALPPYEYAP